MQAFFEILLANTACALVLAAIAWIVNRWAKNPALKHALWLLVLIKLVTPPLFRVPLDLFPSEETPALANATDPISLSTPPPMDDMPVEGQVVLLSASADGELVLGIKLGLPEEELPEHQQVPPAIEPVTSRSSETGVNSEALQLVFFGVWMLGALVWYAYSIWKLRRFAETLSLAKPVSDAVRERASLLARSMGLRRCPSIAFVPGLVPPMLWAALGRPRIYLPGELWEQLDEKEQDSLLIHELAHLRRGDYWVRWLEFIVQGIYWWNPLVPLVRRRLHACEEECCDALVTEAAPSRSYASAIIRTLDFLAGEKCVLPAAVSGLGRTESLRRRLTRILTQQAGARLSPLSRLAVVAAAAVLLPFLPVFARTANSTSLTIRETSSNEFDSADTERMADNRPGVLDSNSNVPRTIAYSPDGSLLALAMEDGRIELRNTATGEALHTLDGHLGPVHCIAFAPNGKVFASAGADRVVRIWNVGDGKLRSALVGHGHWVYALAFSPDGQTLASGGYDRTIRLWDVQESRVNATLRGHASAVRTLVFTPEGAVLASGGSDGLVRLWDTATGRLRMSLPGHTETIRSLAVSADGRILASASEDGTTRLWNLPSGTARGTLRGHDGEVTALAFALSSRLLLTAGADRVLRLWDAGNGRFVAKLPSHTDGVMSLAFDPKREVLTSLGADRLLRHVPLARIAVRVPAEQQGLLVLQKADSRQRIASPNPRITIVEFQRDQKSKGGGS